MEIFYSNQIQGDSILLSEEESGHCVRVLRHRKGDEVKVSGGDGNLYKCILEEANPTAAKLRIESIEGGFGKHNYYLHMAVAPTKNIDRFEWFLEKATEIGVDEITPLCCDHSERKIIKTEREERVVVAAAKQSLKGEIPILHTLTNFVDFIAKSRSFDGVKLIAYCDSELIGEHGIAIKRIPISSAVSNEVERGKELRAIVLIGPEGDFSLEEIRAAADAGFIPISLGESRLRTETAAIVATSAFYLGSLSD